MFFVYVLENQIAKAMDVVIESLDEIPDFILLSILESEKFSTLQQALVQVHRPIDMEQAELARKRLTFDEAFLLQMTLLRRKTELAKISTSSRLAKSDGILAAFDNGLPFKLTGGQIQVCKEITEDLAKSHPMQRLLQGEVGSGKTIVALRAMLTVIDAGGQAALLAPTEVLAQQHYSTINKLLGELASANTLGAAELATRVVLLTGSQSTNERRNALAEIGHKDFKRRTRLNRDGDGWRIQGRKYYCTGALYAHWIPTLVVRDDDARDGTHCFVERARVDHARCVEGDVEDVIAVIGDDRRTRFVQPAEGVASDLAKQAQA